MLRPSVHSLVRRGGGRGRGEGNQESDVSPSRGGVCMLYFLGAKSCDPCDAFVQPAFFFAGNRAKYDVAIADPFTYLFSLFHNIRIL